MTLLHITQQKPLQCVMNILYIKHEWIHDQWLGIIVVKYYYCTTVVVRIYSIIVYHCHGNKPVKEDMNCDKVLF